MLARPSRDRCVPKERVAFDILDPVSGSNEFSNPMKMFNSIRTQAMLCLSLWAALAGEGRSQVFTVQVGGTASPSTPLVSHGELWHYHKGTNAPGAGWQTQADASLDPLLWSTGNGGFGYSTDTPNEVSLCQTILGDMINFYTTLYVRRSFEIAGAVDPARHLLLTMDWDDGFVAYLDGAELIRRNAGTGPAEPANTALASPNHESSRGTSGNAPLTFDLDPVGSRLSPGTHTLAFIALNGTSGSSDLVLLADLSLGPLSPGVVAGPLLAVTGDDSVMLSGTNAIAGSARLTINGADASFNAGTGAWSKQQLLNPGYNRLIVEAVAADGAVLFSTNQTVVSEISSTTITSLAGNTVFDSSMGVIRVPNDLTVPSGGSLTINPGTVLLLGAGINLHATANASITINGTRENPVCLFTADGLTMWGELAADGANSFLTVHHAESIGGAVKGRNGATCLLEDSYFHDYKNGTVPIGGCTSAQSMTVRRCHFRIYHETLWQFTSMLVEDSLFELANNASSDALDFDGAVAGSIIRRCTFRHGPQSNTDAIDLGSTTQPMLVESCFMYDFPNDKGVSIGETTYAIEIRNCLMTACDSGVAVKDLCTAIIHDCTFVDNDYGFRIYNKATPASPTGGGLITNSYNNIIANSRIAALQILNNGVLIADHSDYFGTNWPGVGNFDADPLFLNPAQRDYRLADNSPCIGTGRDDTTIGCKFPVGSPMAPSHSYFSSIVVANDAVELNFWVDSEKNYTVQASDTAAPGSWTKIADVYHQMVPRLAKVTHPLATNHRFYRLVTPVQP